MAISISHRADTVRVRRRPKTWVLVVAATAVLVPAAFVVSRSSVFHARAIDVTGEAHLSRNDVVRIAGVTRSTNVPWLDEGGVERRLEQHPWVAEATVHVSLPWTIEIDIRERFPVAVAEDGTGPILLAADGTVLGSAIVRIRGLPRVDLPPVAAVDGPPRSPLGAAGVLGAMSPELRARVVAITVGVDGALEVRLRDGVRVRYGNAAEAAAKARALERILAWAEGSQGAGDRLLRISLVAPASPAVVLR